MLGTEEDWIQEDVGTFLEFSLSRSRGIFSLFRRRSFACAGGAVVGREILDKKGGRC
jgi:hypothetical protein